MADRLVVEWTRTTLRLALSRGSRGKVRLRALHVEPLGAGAEVAKVLASTCKKVGARTAKAVGVIPRDQVISRLNRFPTVQTAELAQMVELYGKAQLPYPKEQVVVDYQVVEQREGFSTVAVVACRRDTIERQVAPLRAAGLQVEGLTVSSWGVLGWYAMVSRAAGVAEPVLVINRDEERTDLVLVLNGRLLLSRSIGLGARGQSSVDEGVETLAQELDRSLTTVRKELPGIEVRSLLLTGAGPLDPWKEHLSRRVTLPVAAVEATKPLAVRASSAEPTVSPVVVGGVACADLRRLLNLSPPELIMQARHRQQIRDLTMVGILLFVALGLGSSLAALQVFRQQRIASQMDQMLSQIEPMTRQVKMKAQAVQLVASVLSQRHQLATVVGGVFRVTQAAIMLEGLTFERAKRQLVLRGRAPSTKEVLAYLETLERLEGVVEARLKHSTRRLTPTGERTDFELVIQQGRPD